MKKLLRNYVLNYCFLPVLLILNISLFYIYSDSQNFSTVFSRALCELIANSFIIFVCLLFMFMIGHLGSTIYRTEAIRNQQLIRSLDQSIREKVYNIFLDGGPRLEYRPEKYYRILISLGFTGILFPVCLFLIFKSRPLAHQLIDTFKLLSVLNSIALWVFFNFFRLAQEASLRTIKRLSDRCLYYSSESLRRSQIFNTITDVVKVFNEKQQLEPVFEKILQDCITQLNLEVGVIEVYLEDLPISRIRVVVPETKPFELDEDFWEYVIGRSEIHNNIALSKLFKPLADQGFYSIVHVNMEIQGKDVGFMAGFSKNKQDLRAADLDFFYTFGQQASMVLENAYLLEKVKILSVTDGLTGLHNHRYFKDAIVTEVRRAVRYNKSLCIVMIDIDHFKNYNDANGHPAGDKVLQKIAKILKELTRDTDIVARYGGEEFVLVLTEATKEGGTEFARRLCKVVEKEKFENEEAQPGGQLTVSVGVSACSKDSILPAELIDYADKALYKAKESGRNRVVVYGENLPVN
jgi:diguanylate cyclase (GGDEF)-like protein